MEITGVNISDSTMKIIRREMFKIKTKIDIPIHSLYYGINKFAKDIEIDL